MGTTVVKFGGTSLRDAEAIRRAASIVKSDKSRKYTVVSAPGKRYKEDEKITDLLLDGYFGGDNGAYGRVYERFRGIIKELGVNIDIDADFQALVSSRENRSGSDYAASRGEYLTAKIFAGYTGARFIDSAECLFFGDDGVFDAEASIRALSGRLDGEGAVIPGFYGSMHNGSIRTFPRGGSDITGAVVAAAAGASLYENWTDVDGVLLADPKIVDRPEIVDIISYREMRRLSDTGASVLHRDAMTVLKNRNIPINIKNTFSPGKNGTLIVPDARHYRGTYPVRGITGRAGLSLITFEKTGIGEDMRVFSRVIGTLEKRGVRLYCVCVSTDSLAAVISDGDIKCRTFLLNELCADTEPETITRRENIALITVVSSDITREVLDCATDGITAGGKLLLADTGADGMSVTLGTDGDNLTQSVKRIYTNIKERLVI